MIAQEIGHSHDRSMPCPAKGGGQPGTPGSTGPEGFIKELNFWDNHGMVLMNCHPGKVDGGVRRLLSS